MKKNNLSNALTKAEFLDLIKVVKMLYGRDLAVNLLEKNIKTFYDVDSESLTKKEKEKEV
jgi:hypothetical protein